mgnify:CR=1 FL=1
MVRISEISAWWMEDDCPNVSVSGSFLKDFGFNIGKKIVIEVLKGQIVIKPVSRCS